MSYRLITTFLAAGIGGIIIATPAGAITAQPAPSGRECRLETPAQFGPRAPLRSTVCATEAETKRGHYELYWPHWLAQRALPPVRTWVPERT